MLHTKQRRTNIYAALLCVVCAVLFLLSMPTVTARAEDIYSPTVIDDFDGTELDISDYPIISDDYSLRVMQIAETDNGGIAVYVYQPSGNDDVRASSIMLATDALDRRTYKLLYLGNYGTIYKYKVQDLNISNNEQRRYDVTSIYRTYNVDIDKTNSNITEIAYAVGIEWTVSSNGSEIVYAAKNIDVINITDEYVGLLRYKSDGLLQYTDNYYIAFSTDRNIDKLMEADISFHVERRVVYVMPDMPINNGDVIEDYADKVHITYSDKDGNASDGINSIKYSWNCIQTVTDFISTEDLMSEAKKRIENKQWVLRFLSADFIRLNAINFNIYNRTVVSDVSLLTLKFDCSGVVYSLGVVNDKYTASFMPDNWNQHDSIRHNDGSSAWSAFWRSVVDFLDDVADFFNDTFIESSLNWLWWIIVIVIVIFILMFLPVIGPIIIGAFKLLFKGLLWLITAPVRLIRAIIHRGDDT